MATTDDDGQQAAPVLDVSGAGSAEHASAGAVETSADGGPRIIRIGRTAPVPHTVSSTASGGSAGVATLAPPGTEPPAPTTVTSRPPLQLPAPIRTSRSPRPWLWITVVAVGLLALAAVVVLPFVASSGTHEEFGADQSTDTIGATTTAPPTTAALPPATVVRRIATAEPLVFFTIDDGWAITPDVFEQIVTSKVPAVSFPLSDVVERHQDVWVPLSKLAPLQNHTARHVKLDALTLDQQQQEICTASEQIAKATGRFPTMLRPPYGAMNADTPIAAGRCGISHIALWSAEMRDGKLSFMDKTALVPGDIVLFHYRAELGRDLALAMETVVAAGLRPVLLTDYLK